MQNLDQIRASHALSAVKGEGLQKKHVNKLPALIVNNGLLAAAAFTSERKELGVVMDCVAEHLKKTGRLKKSSNNSEMQKELAEGSSAALRLATDEALAYLSFLKRFAKGD